MASTLLKQSALHTSARGQYTGHVAFPFRMTGGVVLATCWELGSFDLVSCPDPTGHETSLDLDVAAVPAEVIGKAWGDEASGNLLQTFWDLSLLEEQTSSGSKETCLRSIKGNARYK